MVAFENVVELAKMQDNSDRTWSQNRRNYEFLKCLFKVFEISNVTDYITLLQMVCTPFLNVVLDSWGTPEKTEK